MVMRVVFEKVEMIMSLKLREFMSEMKKICRGKKYKNYEVV